MTRINPKPKTLFDQLKIWIVYCYQVCTSFSVYTIINLVCMNKDHVFLTNVYVFIQTHVDRPDTLMIT